jgi:hypothetical protein
VIFVGWDDDKRKVINYLVGRKPIVALAGVRPAIFQRPRFKKNRNVNEN